MKVMVRRPIVYVTGAAALVALLVIARPVWNPSTVAPEETSNPSVGVTGPAPVVPVVDLNLDRLRVVGGELQASTRDPFRFRPKPPPPAPRVQAPPPVFVPPVDTGPPPPPAIPLKYFGVISVSGQRVAAFADGRGNTFNAKEGDVLEGRYRLLRIGADWVEVAYVDGRGRQTIRMTGQ
jgi:hypothetical protein